MCLPLRRASVFLRQRAREWTVTGLRMMRPSFTSLRICWPAKTRRWEKKNKQKDKTNHKHTLTKQSRHFKHSHSHQYTFIAGKLIQKLRYRWYDIASFSLSSVSVLKKKLTWHFSQNLSMSIIISERGQGTSVHRKHGHKRFTVHWDIHRKFGDGWLSSI